MKKPEPELKIRERPSETVSVQIPSDTLAALRKVAERRDMSCTALIKLYIGQSLRQDVARLFAENVLETTAEVLARHISSEEAVSAIMEEIRL
jgi:hypothetical protein